MILELVIISIVIISNITSIIIISITDIMITSIIIVVIIITTTVIIIIIIISCHARSRLWERACDSQRRRKAREGAREQRLQRILIYKYLNMVYTNLLILINLSLSLSYIYIYICTYDNTMY